MGGAVVILVGIVELFVIAPAGILFIVLGLGLISYATLTRKTALEAAVSTSPGSGEVEIGAEAESGEEYDFEEDYDRLLNFYVRRWGAALGMDLLDKEIATYTRHGESFAFAIKKISRSHEKDLNKT